MAGKRGKVILVVAALVLLVTLALGFGAPNLSAYLVAPQGGAVQMWDGLGAPMAGPVVGGGSGA